MTDDRHRPSTVLAGAIDQIFERQDFLDFLRFRQRVPLWSWNNTMLTFAYKPYATIVMGFNQWKEHNRTVIKGSKAAPIIVPITKKTNQVLVAPDGTESELTETRFTVRWCIFDVTETQGDPPPEFDVPIMQTWGRDDQLQLLRRVAEDSFGFRVEWTAAENPAAYGSFNYSTQKITMHPELGYGEQGIKTLAHEIAHGLTPKPKTLDKRARETVAESAAFIVCHHLGIDATDRAARYISIWAEDRAIFQAALPVSEEIARKIIAAIDTTAGVPNAAIAA